MALLTAALCRGQDFLGTDNITLARKEHSEDYGTPIDCVWEVKAPENYKIYIQFEKYKLTHPNDCHLNYIQVKGKGRS
jgi:hypothetical protein